jgi:hypothetical protein
MNSDQLIPILPDSPSPLAPVPDVPYPNPSPVISITVDYQLSPNFTFGMLTVTEHREFIDKNFQEAQKYLDSVSKLCKETLEPVKGLMGNFYITSGFRCDELNTAIHGSLTSQHSKGEAVDTLNYNMPLNQVFNKIASSNIPYSQLIFEYGRWVHIGVIDNQLYPGKVGQKLIASIVDGKVTYKPVTGAL